MCGCCSFSYCQAQLEPASSIEIELSLALFSNSPPGPSEAAYLKLSTSEAEFGSKSSELSQVEIALRVGQKLPNPPLPSF